MNEGSLVLFAIQFFYPLSSVMQIGHLKVFGFSNEDDMEDTPL